MGSVPALSELVVQVTLQLTEKMPTVAGSNFGTAGMDMDLTGLPHCVSDQHCTSERCRKLWCRQRFQRPASSHPHW